MTIPCPVCGSKDIEKVMDSNDIAGPGYQQWVEYECCNNCGVMLSPYRRAVSKKKKKGKPRSL